MGSHFFNRWIRFVYFLIFESTFSVQWDIREQKRCVLRGINWERITIRLHVKWNKINESEESWQLCSPYYRLSYSFSCCMTLSWKAESQKVKRTNRKLILEKNKQVTARRYSLTDFGTVQLSAWITERLLKRWIKYRSNSLTDSPSISLSHKLSCSRILSPVTYKSVVCGNNDVIPLSVSTCDVVIVQELKLSIRRKKTNVLINSRDLKVVVQNH